MPRHDYQKKLTYKQIRILFASGRYSLDSDNNIISGRTKKPIFTYTDGTEHGTPYVRLFQAPAYRCIAVSRVVWMLFSKSDIPYGWEIHHVDENPLNNAFENLMCLHPKDHLKLHTTPF